MGGRPGGLGRATWPRCAPRPHGCGPGSTTSTGAWEVLAEDLEEAYARGVDLLADAARLDRRRRDAERELATVQARLDERARSTYMVGSPYVWGAEGPNTFDCSGLTSFAYAAAGITIPRVSRAQFAAYAGAVRSAP